MTTESAQIKDINIDTEDETFTTGRATVPAMENILGKPFKVLDHGFIRVVDYMGDDSAIVQAARVSYGKGTKQVNQDKGLINYLLRHRHTTPFEMCEIKLHVKLPMFVARQWIRHRTANVNEYSARYSVLDHEYYLPSADNLAAQSTKNMQGREEVIPEPHNTQIRNTIKEDSERCYANYIHFLNESEQEDRPGLARELARMNLPINFYTQWYWKTNLHNLMHFIALRADKHAQYEIRVYAQIMRDEILKRWLPLTFDAFTNYREGSCHLSDKMQEVVRKKMKGESVDQASSGLSSREWHELCEKFPELIA